MYSQSTSMLQCVSSMLQWLDRCSQHEVYLKHSRCIKTTRRQRHTAMSLVAPRLPHFWHSFVLPASFAMLSHNSIAHKVQNRHAMRKRLTAAAAVVPAGAAHNAGRSASGVPSALHQQHLTPAQQATQAAITAPATHQDGKVPVRTGLAWAALGGSPPPPPPHGNACLPACYHVPRRVPQSQYTCSSYLSYTYLQQAVHELCNVQAACNPNASNIIVEAGRLKAQVHMHASQGATCCCN